jgi:hypothetical protein
MLVDLAWFDGEIAVCTALVLPLRLSFFARLSFGFAIS